LQPKIELYGQEASSTYDDKTKDNGSCCSNPGDGEIEESADSQNGGDQNTKINSHGVAVLAK